MQTSHDEFVLVNVDELMFIHNQTMVNRFDIVLEGSVADNYKMDSTSTAKNKIKLN